MNKNRLADLRNLEVNIDPGVWKSIEDELDRRRKRRMFFLWLLAGGAVISSLIFTGIQYKETSSAKRIKSEEAMAVIDNIRTNEFKTNQNNLMPGSKSNSVENDPIKLNQAPKPGENL